MQDIIYGLAGTDFIYGGHGHDTIYGGYQSDLIYGEDGNGECNRELEGLISKRRRLWFSLFGKKKKKKRIILCDHSKM